jgi:hypothetical protein
VGDQKHQIAYETMKRGANALRVRGSIDQVGKQPR